MALLAVLEVASASEKGLAACCRPRRADLVDDGEGGLHAAHAREGDLGGEELPQQDAEAVHVHLAAVRAPPNHLHPCPAHAAQSRLGGKARGAHDWPGRPQSGFIYLVRDPRQEKMVKRLDCRTEAAFKALAGYGTCLPLFMPRLRFSPSLAPRPPLSQHT